MSLRSAPSFNEFLPLKVTRHARERAERRLKLGLQYDWIDRLGSLEAGIAVEIRAALLLGRYGENIPWKTTSPRQAGNVYVWADLGDRCWSIVQRDGTLFVTTLLTATSDHNAY